MRTSEADRKIVKGFQRTLASLLGEGGAETVMKLANVSPNKLEPQKLEVSLQKLFGTSAEGLSTLEEKVVSGMSSDLDTPLDGAKNNNFASSLEAISAKYRLKEKTGLGLAGLAAAIGSSICCLGPIALGLLGFASVSASASLAIDLTSKFRPIEIGVSVALLSATVIAQLLRMKQCNLQGLRRNLGYVAVPVATLVVSYSLLNYWLGAAYLGGFNLKDLLP